MKYSTVLALTLSLAPYTAAQVSSNLETFPTVIPTLGPPRPSQCVPYCSEFPPSSSNVTLSSLSFPLSVVSSLPLSTVSASTSVPPSVTVSSATAPSTSVTSSPPVSLSTSPSVSVSGASNSGSVSSSAPIPSTTAPNAARSISFEVKGLAMTIGAVALAAALI
ncbi:hypothetical protein FB451DRAFT_607984 [Mycena latifolia]|nr:hypothetical protein FB451DRAFT_607984 [Mycena latifolia]